MSLILAGALAVLVSTPPSFATPATLSGLGVDSCAAPNDWQVGWLRSHGYNIYGAYLGGGSYGCSWKLGWGYNKSENWAQRLERAGFTLAPIWVGLYCTTNGAYQADQAIAAASAAHVSTGIIFEDYEPIPACRSTGLAQGYIGSWSRELHARGWRAGLYGDFWMIGQQIAPLGGSSRPDVVWSSDHGSTYEAGWPNEGVQFCTQYGRGGNCTLAGSSYQFDQDRFVAGGASAGPAVAHGGGPSCGYGTDATGPGCSGFQVTAGQPGYAGCGLTGAERYAVVGGSAVSVKWSFPNLARDASYDVEVNIPNCYGDAAAGYTVWDGGGSHTVPLVDQNAYPQPGHGSNQWFSLGTFLSQGGITLGLSTGSSQSWGRPCAGWKGHACLAIDGARVVYTGHARPGMR